MSLPIIAAVQISAQNRKLRQSSEALAYLEGLRSAEWFCFALMVVSLAFAIVGLRNIGKIGQLKKLGHVQSATKEQDGER